MKPNRPMLAITALLVALVAGLLLRLLLTDDNAAHTHVPLRGEREVASPSPRSTIKLVSADDQGEAIPAMPLTGSNESMVTVVDSADHPVTGAEVYVGEGNDRIGPEATSADGIARVRIRPALATMIAASHPGYSIGLVQLNPEVAPRPAYMIHLIDEVTITGTVMDAVGGQPQVAYVVKAWRPDAARSEGDVRGVSLEALRVPEALSGADGTFTLRGLAPKAGVTLIAYGPGRLSWPVSASGGDRSVVLKVEQGYGALIRLEDAEGGRPRSNPRLLGRGPTIQEPGGGHYLSPNRADLALIGIPADLLGPRSRDACLVLHSDTHSGAQITATVLLDAPGYESVTADIVLGPLHEGIPEYSFPLRRKVDGFGTVRVHLADPTVPDRNTLTGHTSIWLLPGQADDVDSAALAFEVQEWKSGVIEVKGIPWGSYSLQVNALHGMFRRTAVCGESASQSFTLAGAPVDVTVDASGTCGLEILSADSSGNFLDRIGFIDLKYEGAPTSSQIGFRTPPYRVSLLPPGRCKIKLVQPYEATAVDESGQAIEWVNLVAGKVTKVHLSEHAASLMPGSK